MIVTPVPGGRILGANAALSNITPLGWNAGGYLGTHSIGSESAFDIQYNKSLEFHGNGRDINLDLGPVFAASAGVVFQF